MKGGELEGEDVASGISSCVFNHVGKLPHM
jgi:hypothetical protein